MQLRWIAIGVVCFSAALLSACGNASGDMSARSASAAMSKTGSRYDSSDKDKNKSDDDECDESDDSDKSSSKSKSLTTSSSKSKDDDSDECKESDDDHKSSGHSSSKSMSVASKSSSKDGKDHDKDDDDTCKVTICHIPPGNTCKPHKIRVGKSAVQAHVEHGDYPGACDPGPVDPPPPPPPPPSPPPPPVCVPDLGACTVDADCCALSVCLPDLASATGKSCGVAG
jgi:hypothetical protein